MNRFPFPRASASARPPAPQPPHPSENPPASVATSEAFRRRLAAALALLGLIGALTSRAWASESATPAEGFFAGKTITYVVATKPGGGYDTYARLIAQFLEMHLPGARVRVKNVPGAGHLVGLSQLALAPADGLTIGTFNTGLIYSQLLGLPGMSVDLRELDWIGKAASDARVMVVSTRSGIDGIDGLRNRDAPALFASSGRGTASHNETVLLAATLDLDIRVIAGFGGAEGEMAMLRGEVQGTVGSRSSLMPFVDNGHGRILLRVGRGLATDDQVPAAADLIRDRNGRRIVAVIRTLAELGRMTAAPGGVPPARLAILREAYAEALADPQLLATAARLQIPIDPLPGDLVASRIAEALTQPAEVVALMRAALPQARP